MKISIDCTGRDGPAGFLKSMFMKWFIDPCSYEFQINLDGAGARTSLDPGAEAGSSVEPCLFRGRNGKWYLTGEKGD